MEGCPSFITARHKLFSKLSMTGGIRVVSALSALDALRAVRLSGLIRIRSCGYTRKALVSKGKGLTYGT